MQRIVIYITLISAVLSIISGVFQLKEPLCGWELIPRPNYGFPVQYMRGPIPKKAFSNSDQYGCAAGVSMNESFSMKAGFELVPDLTVFPILFLINTLIYTAISSFSFLIILHFLKQNKKK